MNRPDPDWYTELKAEPLRVRMFTPGLAARIRAEAVRQAEAKAPLTRRVLYVGAAAGCLAAILLLAAEQHRLTLQNMFIGDAVEEPEHLVSASGGGQGAATGRPPVQAETDGGGTAEDSRNGDDEGHGDVKDADPAENGESAGTPEPAEADPADGMIRYAGHSKVPALAVAEPSGEEWQWLIDESYPEFRTDFLHEEAVGDGQRLIFSRKMTADGEALYGEVAAYEFEWTADGWQRRAGAGYKPTDNLLDSESRMIVSQSVFSREDRVIDIFMGFVLDPDIVRVHVRDERDGVHEARLFPETGGVTTWFAYNVPEQPRLGYVIEGLDAEGDVVYSESSGGHSTKYRGEAGQTDEASGS